MCTWKFVCFFINCSGDKPEIRRLKSSAVPSIFPWSQPPSVSAVQWKARAHRRVEKLCEEVCPNVEASECVETIGANESTENVESPILTTYVTVASQTKALPRFSIQNFIDDPAAVHYYTGLESYEQFYFVLSTLGPAAISVWWICCN